MTTLYKNYQNIIPQKQDNNNNEEKNTKLNNIDVSKPQSMEINSSSLKELKQNNNNPLNTNDKL